MNIRLRKYRGEYGEYDGDVIQLYNANSINATWTYPDIKTSIDVFESLMCRKITQNDLVCRYDNKDVTVSTFAPKQLDISALL